MVLIIAAKDGHSDMGKQPIDAISDVNLQTRECGTALVIAAQNGHSDIIRYLIKQMPMLICRLKMVICCTHNYCSEFT